MSSPENCGLSPPAGWNDAIVPENRATWLGATYKDIKIKEYVGLSQFRFVVQHFVNFYNSRQIHSVLRYRTPDEVYFGTCNRQSAGYSKSRSFAPIFS